MYYLPLIRLPLPSLVPPYDQLHASMVKAIRAGFTAAVQDDELTQMGKRVLIEMLSDARFHRAILKGAMGAIKAGVRDALRDEELVEGFKETLVDALQDEELHIKRRKNLLIFRLSWMSVFPVGVGRLWGDG